ncbi:Sbal_3080 family lipoprotein [Pseudomonas oryzihabitans]|uniref:Sbal_3080 family lipoprotein n=1 Tax=Pseudomonas oryzihabitans TaxID=47885 RepID=UPI002895272B|nr:Sbal_3080 family lipoprotein [Pseudomonas oryzihabitans]MDT3718383.1 Sbal_3080 family lipoprotein [Pseudomonas oryzihabitans]
MKRTIILLAALLGGCSIKQQVAPAELSAASSSEICTIPAVGLRSGFNTTYVNALQQKGFKVRPLSAGSNPGECELSTTYTATWGWDLALYMKFADIRVFQNGRQIGQAVYDSRWGSGRPDKFINAENKINQLADELFPRGASVLAARYPVSSSIPAPGSLSKEAQIQALQGQGLSYEEYSKRYREILAQ